LLNEALSSLI